MRRQPPNFCKIWELQCKEYKQSEWEDDYREARKTFVRGKKRHEEKKGIKQVDFLDIAHTDLDSPEIAQNLRKGLGDHRIRIVRIKDGEQTVGLLLVFDRDDEKRIETYKEKLEEDNKKHTGDGDQSVIVKFVLQEPAEHGGGVTTTVQGL